MDIINILLSSELPGGMHRFEHDGLALEFDRLEPGGPRRLIEGPVWAFVDWLLPELSGLEMCRRLRSSPPTELAHITMVIEEDDAETRRRALKAGADDYMVGPLDRTRVLDRILAVQIRDLHGAPPKVVSHGELAVDLAALQARCRGATIPLMPNEFRLLRYLVEHPGRVFSREQLIEALGKREPAIDERTVDVWIGRLRRALRAAGAGEPLRTVRNHGYVLDVP